MPARAWITIRRKRQLASRCTLVVIALQVGLLLTFLLTPTHLPPRLTLFELLWAAARKPTFYPLIALVIAGPALSLAALHIPGRHRLHLLLAWAVFLGLFLTVFADRLNLMLRILWQQL